MSSCLLDYVEMEITNRISVVATTYNDAKEIRELLDDVEKQTVRPYEFVIADGGSRDETVDIISEYASKSELKIKILSGRRLNISQGLNEAIRESTGEYVAIVGTGNAYDSDYIEKLCSSMVDGVDVVYAPIRGEITNYFTEVYCKAFLNGARGSYIPSNHGALIRRTVFIKVGLFYEHFVYAGEDEEFYKRVSLNKLKAICSECANLKWRVPDNIKAFNRQRKAYFIAAMQINTNTEIISRFKANIILLLVGIIALMSLYFCNYIFWSAVILYFAALMYKSFNHGILPVLLKRYTSWYLLGVLFGNLQYLKESNKVKRGIIEKLDY